MEKKSKRKRVGRVNLRIFTDGACSGNPGPGGWAIVVNRSEECVVMSGGDKETTNNRMELTAAINAVDYVLKNELLSKECTEVEIISDSAYVVNAINKAWLHAWKMSGWKTAGKTDVANKDLWQIMYEKFNMCKGKVKFVKVKGHSGNSFNEMADKEARKACRKMQDV